MKIGWAKFTMSMELDYNEARNGHGEERPMMLKGMLDRGHSVVLLTPVLQRDLKILGIAKTGKRPPGIVDNSWLKGINYRPDGFADDCDVLIVENGPDNFTFTDPYFKIPQIRRAMELIDEFRGLVILNQSDPLLPFPLWRLTHSEYPWSHPKNKCRNEGKGTEEYGWGDYEEMFREKTVVVMGKCPWPRKEYPWHMTGNRARYDFFAKRRLVNFVYLPTGYDKHFIPHIKFNWDSKQRGLGLIYAGFPRSRVQSFRKFYGNHLDKTNVFGPWESGADRKKLLEEFRSKGMVWHGFLKGFTNITEAYSCSKCCVNLMPKRAQPLGWVVNRLFEAVASNCLVLGDEETAGIDRYVPEAMIVNAGNVRRVIDLILSATRKQYIELLEEQRSLIGCLDYDYVVSELEGIIDKFLSRPYCSAKKRTRSLKCLK